MDKDKRMQKIVFWLFLAPALISFFMVQIIPFVIGFYYSFTDWSATAQITLNFVGLKNYADAFKDTTFLYSTIITSIYTLLNIVLVNVVAFEIGRASCWETV